jgi:hypothetical protein
MRLPGCGHQITHSGYTWQFTGIKSYVGTSVLHPENIYGSVYLKRDFMDRF